MCDPVVPPESMGRGLVQSVGALYGGVFADFNFLGLAGNRDHSSEEHPSVGLPRGLTYPLS